jgi:hypothetical protein
MDQLTKETLKELYPEIHAAVFDEGRVAGHAAGLAAGKTEGLSTGAETERTRIKGVFGMFCRKDGQLVAGLEVLGAELMFDGTTTAEQAAVRIVAKERETGASLLSSFETAGAEASRLGNPAAAAAGDGKETALKEGEDPGAKVHQLTQARQRQDKITYGEAMTLVLAENPKLAAAYMRNNKLDEGGR